MKRISITAEIDLDALAEQLVDCTDYAETITLIKRIDARIADLAFTRELARHFAEEVKRETDDGVHSSSECKTCLGSGRLGFEDGHRKCLDCNGSGVSP